MATSQHLSTVAMEALGAGDQVGEELSTTIVLPSLQETQTRTKVAKSCFCLEVKIMFLFYFNLFFDGFKIRFCFVQNEKFYFAEYMYFKYSCELFPLV